MKFILPLFAFFLCASAHAASDSRVVVVGNLIYAGDQTSVCFSDRFLTTVETEGGIRTEKRMRAIRVDAWDEMVQVSFAIMNGQNDFVMPDSERENLRGWLEAGGFLVASAGCSSEKWSAAFRRELALTFPEQSLQPVPLDHPAFHTVFDLETIDLKHGGSPLFEGLYLDGRLAVLFTKEGLNDTEHTQGCCCCGGNEVRQAEEVMVNVLAYALVE